MTFDPRPVFAQALDQAGALVQAAPADAMRSPTPCTEFCVRDLLGHLDAVQRRVAHVIDGGHPRDIPQVIDGVADDEWTSTWAVDRAALDLRLGDDSMLDRALVLPFGELPGRAALGAYIGEVTTHCWDLATAIGRADLLHDDLAAGYLPMAQQFVPADPRGGTIPFGPMVPVAEDAPAYERLAGWMGRDPNWSAIRAAR